MAGDGMGMGGFGGDFERWARASRNVAWPVRCRE